jgi:hypothetical protein
MTLDCLPTTLRDLNDLPRSTPPPPAPMRGAAKPSEHRARELLNLLGLARRCLDLPGLSRAERAEWHAEIERSRGELRALCAAGLDLSLALCEG